MRIGLVSLDYPPASTEGVARQRQALAQALVHLGHDVHVVTLGRSGGQAETIDEDGVRVHRVPRTETVNTFLPALPVLDRPLTDAQLLCEGVLTLAARVRLDVVDVPLWLAQPLALIGHAPCPVVVWLQTTLLHLVELRQREARPHEVALANIDRYALSHADGCIADSSSILSDVERLYGLSLQARTSVVHPGLPDDERSALSLRSTSSREGGSFEVLVVGRLEQRKGTRRLFDALPRLFAAVPDLRVTFIGRDNSASDGFLKETGLTYPEAFAVAHPGLASRVRFTGYVEEAALTTRYASADVLLHPALYESFGLIFLEAMRASLPTVAFGAGGAIEIFARGERDGAVLCDADDMDALVDGVVALARNPKRRAALSAAARRAFERAFTSERMARETADVYTRVIARTAVVAGPRQQRRARRSRGRIFQIMEALQDRDAVSRIARTNAATLAEFGAERPIISLFAEASVRPETGRLRGARFNSSDAAIFHYWGFSRLERLIEQFPGRKAIHYHNITPPEFFAPRTAHYEMTARGYAQLDRIADRFDLVIGDSTYNLEAYAQHMSVPKPMLCLYPVVDAPALRGAAWDAGLESRVRRESDGPIWLFVGRFAPNKRQDQVMRAFDRFAAVNGGGRLLLIGDMHAVPAFVATLEQLRGQLPNGHRIEFMPSQPDELLRACYRAADLFVCASEHEGFCMPLAEAMAFDVPTIALDRGAVGETLGNSGLLVRDWDPEQVAALATAVLRRQSESGPLAKTEGQTQSDPISQSAVIERQRVRLQSFSPASIRPRLEAAVHYLRDGSDSPLFVRFPPHRSRLLEAS